MTFTIHDGHYVSLLSEAPPKDGHVQLIGIVNLLGLLLITSGVHKALTSFKK